MFAPTLYTLAAAVGSATGDGVIEAPSDPGTLRADMALGLTSRSNLTLMGLFALAFGGVIVYVNAGSNGEVPTQPLPTQPTVPATDLQPRHRTGDFAPETQGAPSSQSTAVAETPPHPPATSEDAPLTEQQQQDLTRWSNQVVSAHTPETRGDAIRELAMVKNQEAIRALTHALSSDEEPANRLAAVASLSSLARDGYEVGAIRDTLRLAAADMDQDVAEHAKDAYDELMRTDESK